MSLQTLAFLVVLVGGVVFLVRQADKRRAKRDAQQFEELVEARLSDEADS